MTHNNGLKEPIFPDEPMNDEEIDRQVEYAKSKSGKAPLGLVSPDFVEEVARVLKFGDDKHKDCHWKDGVSVSLLLESAERHLNEIKRGDMLDDETHLQHTAHIASIMMMIHHYVFCCSEGSGDYEKLFEGLRWK